MAEEIKQENTEQTTATRGRKPAERMYSKDELDAMVKTAVAEALKAAQLQSPTVMQVKQDEYVTILYVGRFASGTTLHMPHWGTITIPGETIDVPKKDFIRGLGDLTNKALIAKKKVFVIDGLTEAERKRFNLVYEDGKYLSQEIFHAILNYPKDKICAIYEKLCDEHKKLVADMFMDAYFATGDKRVAPDTVKALNTLSKKIYKDGLFTRILEDMGKKFADE